MRGSRHLDPVNVIGISLIVVAIVSAGGLYHIGATYAGIAETFATVSCSVSHDGGVSIVRDSQTGEVTVHVTFLVDNSASSLDIDVYRIEYRAFADRTPTSITDYDKDVGGGSFGGTNGTVLAGTMREITVSFSITPNSTNMERFTYAEQDGQVYILINGKFWYNIEEYPEAMNKLYLPPFMGEVVVNDR